jgi:CAAX prenyl protease-like protein
MLRSLEQFAAARPDAALVTPLMVYIALLALAQAVPETWLPGAIALRGVASLAAVWIFRRHLPPWGNPHWLIAIAGGALAAWGWVVGQYAADHVGLGGRLPLMPGEKSVVDLRDQIGAGDLFWTIWWLRISVAVLAVPVVEELFWRAFLLRALIDWQHFERLPLGQFSWRALVGTALLSTLQHPDNWGVSILCWLLFNGVFYWTRSLLCLVLLHGFTNLVLYLIALRTGDWSFW